VTPSQPRKTNDLHTLHTNTTLATSRNRYTLVHTERVAMTPEKWLHDNARFKRTITAVALRVGLNREKGHCTWCNKKFCDNNARRWCSEECREEGYVRFGYWQGPVENRDKGICDLCGFDSLAYQQRIKRLQYKAKGGDWLPDRERRYFPHTFSRIRKFSRRTGIYGSGQPYEIDHIIPVVEGGGCCGLDNLRTLCFPCHKSETKALAGRRAAARRDTLRPLLAELR